MIRQQLNDYLLRGTTDIKDVNELFVSGLLSDFWLEDGQTTPTFSIYVMADNERRRREVEAASKKRPIRKDFF